MIVVMPASRCSPYERSEIREQLKHAIAQLSSISDTANLDAEILLAHVLNKPRSYFYTWPENELTLAEQQQFAMLITQRCAGMPIAYLIGKKEFWDLLLTVTSDTLIPRSETELLVECVLNCLPATSLQRVADLGTGSGAIALALAHERPHWEIHATDISPAALQVAQANARHNSLDNIQFHVSNWCAALPQRYFQLIVSNPPYLPSNDEHLAALRHEPTIALIAGDDGLAALREVIQQAHNCLLPQGWLLLEHGWDQKNKIAELLLDAGYSDIQNYLDLAGHPRVTAAKIAKT